MKISGTHLVLCMLVGCSDRAELAETHETDALRAEDFRLDAGLEDGLWAIWHESGQMQARGQFKNGKGDGPWTFFEEDGQLGATGQWKLGRRDGRWTSWHENGAMKSAGRLKNEKREGLWTCWHENGVQQAEGPFVLDRREGAWTFWDEDGDIKAAGMYAQGQPVGDWYSAPAGWGEKKDAVRARAEALLQVLRAGQWEDAADFVLVNEATRRHLSISEGASLGVRSETVARFFEGLYGSRGPTAPQGPGHVRSVRIDPEDPGLADISYRYGDIDGFKMRMTEGEWYYSFE